MSYAIIRNAKYKKDNLAGLYKHNERKNTNYSNKDINKQKSKLNYSIKQCNTTYSNALKILVEKNNLQGRITKISNVVCEIIVTSDREFFENIGEVETRRYFQTAYNFISTYNNLGEEYILSAKVHMDESTPHIHIVFVPVVHKTDQKSGKIINKIACSEYWKGKDSYKRLQDAFYKYIINNGFKLERGKSSNAKHLNIDTLKQITNYDNIKYELAKEQIQPIKTKNKDLIIQQNEELIKNNNKLKIYLTKFSNVINQMELLQKDNLDLKHKNEELQKENYNLKNYITKTFEVVKNLFDFPIDRLKRLVDNFIKNLER